MLYTYIKQNYKFTDEDKKEALKTMELIVEIAQTVRKNGLLFIDDKIPTYENPFLRKAMTLAVDSNPPEAIEDLLDKYIIFGDYTSKEMLELLLIKEGTIAIVNGENPLQIKEKLAAFFGINFENETKEVYQNFVNTEINKFYQNIKAGNKFFPQEANLLEEKFKNLSDGEVQILNRDTEVNDVILAINGSSAEVTQKILANMSKRNSDSIAEIIVFNRNWKKYNTIEDIIAAQKRILAKIDDLKSE